MKCIKCMKFIVKTTFVHESTTRNNILYCFNRRQDDFQHFVFDSSKF